MISTTHQPLPIPLKKNKSPHPTIKMGIQPTGWTNDDFPEIGNDTPYQQILLETNLAGFQGGSTGHNYPPQIPSLKTALEFYGLGITSTWVGTHFTAPDQYASTIQNVRDQITFLKAVGATDIVVAELAGAVNQVRTKSVLTDRPIFNDVQKRLLYRGLNEAGKIAARAKMRLSYHPHVGTGVQQVEETDELLKRTKKEYVWLCLDTGHIKLAGDDPDAIAMKYADRIGHVHLKNVRQEIVDAARRNNYSFFEAILAGVFTVPGDPYGSLQFNKVFQSLKKFKGWIVVEAEQDPAPPKSSKRFTPLEYATMAGKFLHTQLKDLK